MGVPCSFNMIVPVDWWKAGPEEVLEPAYQITSSRATKKDITPEMQTRLKSRTGITILRTDRLFMVFLL
jgi:hypothetical protein